MRRVIDILKFSKIFSLTSQKAGSIASHYLEIWLVESPIQNKETQQRTILTSLTTLLLS